MAATVLVAGCGSSGSGSGDSEGLQGSIVIDGSSTVFPIEDALHEFFAQENRGVRFSIAQSGTGAGMEKLAKGEIDISGASRPIKASEIENMSQNGIEFVEVPVAYDGLSIVVSNENDWISEITIDQLNQIWNESSEVKNWSDIDSSWPSEPITLYGPTSAHGTFDYFNEAVNGDSKNTRQDYEKCAEYNTLVNGVSNSKYSLGYVGYSYVELNKDKLKVIPVVNSNGDAVAPSADTIMDGTYEPLSRPLMIYVNAEALKRPEVKAFVMFAITNGDDAINATGYIPLPTDARGPIKKRIEGMVTGSVLSDVKPGTKLSEILATE